ncbi:odorant receptor 67d-like [Lucilia cuprina]|uniref:odorant receptor 67d-like n=1 Tax=Lucilia cuprina TaxID=7375 RepID=UPI001F070A16|nr:odorant receptor 67d-like [Lucilia cuprina]
MAKNCSDRYNKITRITRMMAAVCGADIVDPNFRMSLLTWTVIFAINAFFCCTIYTIYIGLVVEGDWKLMLQTLSLVGSAAQGYSKLLVALFRRWDMVSMNGKLLNIYLDYENDKDFCTILSTRIDMIIKIFKFVLLIYIIVVSIIVLYPLIYGMLYGEKLFVMQFLLPGIDPLTHFGYVVHNVVHVFLLCLGGFGNFAGDMYIFIFILHIPMLKDILRIKFEKLNRITLQKQNSSKTLPLLKEIVEWHQNYNKFVKQVEGTYYSVIFVQISTSVVGICCTIFSIVIHSWPAAFVYLAYSAIMLYAYCGLGHLVEISNDEVIDVIYGDCLWYEMSVQEQKLVLLMLRKSQRPTTLTIGQIMPLSMSTALQLTKAIYSYMMMLLNFLESDDM